MADYIWETPTEINLGVARRMRDLRKRRKITQKELAERSNVSFASVKKFERTGDISLRSLTKIAMELGVSNQIRGLFSAVPYATIAEVIDER